MAKKAWDGKTPKVNLGEASPARGEGAHRYRFGQHPIMPWKMVECPACNGWGFVERREDGKMIDCSLCEGEGEIREFRRREYLKSQEISHGDV